VFLVRSAKWLTIGVFLLLLVLPAIQERSRFITCQEVNENRSKCARPKASLVDVLLNRHGAAAEYEKFYNDHYGLRDLFIRLKNQIDFSIFSKSDKVHVGPDGWLFYRTVLDGDQTYLERSYASHEKDYQSAVERLRQYLGHRGVTLVVMPCPQKNTVYPEFVPPSAPRRPEEIAFHRFCSLVKHDPGVIFIDVFAELSKLKSQYQVYYRTDFHWTDVAAYFLGKVLVERIGLREGMVPRYHPLLVKTELFRGGQALFIPMLWTPEERAQFPLQNWPEGGRYDHPTQGPYEFIYRNHEKGILPCVVVYGDSFADGLLRTGFNTYFKEVYRARVRGASWDKLLEALPAQAKYLVVEHIEVATDFVWTGLPRLDEGRQLAARPASAATK
jgi:hypothetical protein